MAQSSNGSKEVFIGIRWSEPCLLAYRQSPIPDINSFRIHFMFTCQIRTHEVGAALNAVEQRLAAMLNDKNLPAYVYGDLKREELVRTGSVALHEIYFAGLGGDGKPGGKALDL